MSKIVLFRGKSVSQAAATVVWSLATVLLLVASAPSLLACDDGTAVPDPEDNPGLVQDCKTLLAVRDELVNNGANLNWDARWPIAKWRHITVTGSPPRVVKIDFHDPRTVEFPNMPQPPPREPLRGSIPPELGQLTGLQVLTFAYNRLTGPIPPELGQLPRLNRLDLFDNQLTGPIPPELGRLPELEYLRLHNNRLTGPIPPELGQLPVLLVLDLSDNQLTGPIPPELGQLPKLYRLRLFDNQLTGPIPPELGRLPELEYLRLFDNQLTGPIPPELRRLPNLLLLGLSHNRLTGPIPPELGQLPKLIHLGLSNNRLTGPIPPELGQSTKFSTLNLSHNRLTGPLPPELGQLPRLNRLDLSHNRLTGPIPPELGELTELRWLHLNNNRLTGPIPPELGELAGLWFLHLQHNQLTGPIPPELGKLTYLREFSFRRNQVTEPVPETLSHLSDVYVLNLAAIWVGPGQMLVTWDDPGDPSAQYEYRLTSAFSDSGMNWAKILDPEAALRAGEGVTIEWLLAMPIDTNYDRILMRVSNRKGTSPETWAWVRKMETSVETTERELATTLYFPHYTDGGGWSVQLVFSHLATTTENAAVVVTAYDQDGQPISGFFDYGDMFEIPPQGTQVLRSAGIGTFRSGWIEAQTDRESLSGLLIFRNSATGIEVSVEPVALGHEFALFVEDSSTIGTGLALFKPDRSSKIEFRLRDEAGRDPLDGRIVTWGDFQHEALTLPEWFDVEGVEPEFLQDFRGVLYLRTEDGFGFAPLGLRFGKGGGSLSAVPVVPLTAVPE